MVLQLPTNIYFENGTCKCPNANAGDTATISGTLYTVVDNSTIQGLVNNGNFNLCTTKVTNMSGVFNSKTSFNTNINFWDTSNVTDMNAMFYNATAFNQNISSWDTSKVVNMHRLFYLATSFNQPIGNWNTSSANNMSGMFEGASAFNQNIGNWNTSNLIQNNNLSGGGGLISTFKDASAFNQNLSGWCVSNIGSEPNNFSTSSALSNANKPKWGKEFSISLTSGNQSQTVTATNAITPIQYSVTPICNSATSVNASSLPTGVTGTLNNNIIAVSGTPTAQSSGTYNYSLYCFRYY